MNKNNIQTLQTLVEKILEVYGVTGINPYTWNYTEYLPHININTELEHLSRPIVYIGLRQLKGTNRCAICLYFMGYAQRVNHVTLLTCDYSQTVNTVINYINDRFTHNNSRVEVFLGEQFWKKSLKFRCDFFCSLETVLFGQVENENENNNNADDNNNNDNNDNTDEDEKASECDHPSCSNPKAIGFNYCSKICAETCHKKGCHYKKYVGYDYCSRRCGALDLYGECAQPNCNNPCTPGFANCSRSCAITCVMEGCKNRKEPQRHCCWYCLNCVF